MIKRLRYMLWAFTLCFELEIEPNQCPSNAPFKVIDDCGCRHSHAECMLKEGHPFKHANDLGQEWD